ncbi:MAG TPA: MFS transporter [Baekduia sp.]|uniref:MFS transporter n=1 Tax=Baekduia sp. TaxID=2600305 RepID=UPI002B7FB715|nr:MFS transporter [Baekduia sp.]HMJ37870.1 MFS transporter [Baekduia sp.]
MHTALRHPRFARLLAALAISQAGDWLYNLALLAYVDHETHSATWLGLTTAARVAPIVVAGPLGGVLADRVDRRTLMIATDVVRALLMGLLALVAIAGLPVVLAPALAALATLAAVPHAPCVAVSTPQLVDADDLPAANAARAAIGPTCIVVGPALGAVLLLLGPPSLAFALNGLTFVGSALLVASIPAGAAFRPAARTDGCSSVVGRPTVLADLRAGAHALLTRPAACRLVGADVACSLVYGAQTVLLLLVAGRLGLGADGYGYLLGAIGLGGVIGAVVAGRLSREGRQPAALAGALLCVAVPLPLLGIVDGLGLALGLSFVGGVGAITVEVLAETGLQRSLPADVLGRAYGFALPAALSGIVAGSLLAPVLVALAGLGGALTLLGAAVALVAVAVARPPRVATVTTAVPAAG